MATNERCDISNNIIVDSGGIRECFKTCFSVVIKLIFRPLNSHFGSLVPALGIRPSIQPPFIKKICLKCTQKYLLKDGTLDVNFYFYSKSEKI